MDVKRAFGLILLIAVAGLRLPGQAAGDPSGDGEATREATREVLVACFVNDVRRINDSEQTLEVDLLVRLRWQDDELRHDGGRLRKVDPSDVWRPEIQALTGIDLREQLDDVLLVDPDGSVRWRQRITGRMSFVSDYADFPFDRHDLPIHFVSPPIEPAARFVKDPVLESLSMMGERVSVPNWRITGASMEIASQRLLDVTVPGFAVHLEAERDPSSYLWKLIVPLCLVVLMSWTAFWVDPGQVGPQISVAVTSMLTLIAYRMSLSFMVPTLPYLTRLDRFMLGATLIVLLALCEVVGTSRLADSGRSDVARRVDRRARVVFPLVFVAMLVTTLVL